MRIGDVIESSIWMTGDESQAVRQQYELDVSQAIGSLCDEHGFECGPVKFSEKHPSEDRVPEVPDHIQGSRVRLLVAEAEVIARVVRVEGSFVANLETKDLQRLRLITRQASRQVLTDQECDAIIERYGPDAAIETLRKHVGSSVH